MVRIGTRESELAMAQTQLVLSLLKSQHPTVTFEVIGMKTTGDRQLHVPLHAIGSKSLFTKELEQALDDSQVDLVVHSYKDVPTLLPPRMTIGAVLKREAPFDAVVLSRQMTELGFRSLRELPAGSRVGTSSVRRLAQLRRWRQDLEYKDIRGNLNTRLRKLDADDVEAGYDALVLAYAGLHRLGWNDRIQEVLEVEGEGERSLPMLYAVSQGAIAIECRKEDEETLRLVQPLNDFRTQLETEAERMLMRSLEGGCSLPIGVYSQWTTEKDDYQLKAIVCAVAGTEAVETSVSLKRDEMSENAVEVMEQMRQVGFKAAQRLRAEGAEAILKQVHSPKN